MFREKNNMRFINPKIRFAFTKIFGYAQNTDILISFLNAILYEGQPIIESLEIIDSYVVLKIVGAKDSYLDVIAKLNNGTSVIIEIQVLYVETLAKLVLYNSAKTYGTQLMIGELYKGFQPVISLMIAEFEMFDNCQDVTSRFVFKEKTHLFDYPYNQIELVFVELPKFKKELEQLENIKDKWIYFLKHCGILEEIPAEMSEIPQIRRAFEIANEVNLTSQESDTLQKQEFFVQDMQSLVEEAREEGREEGRQEAKQKGRQEGQVKLIMRLLSRRLGQINPDIESRIRQLPIDKLENLAEAMLDFSNAEDLTAWLEANSPKD
jgi:predicted transposase/invertase (TIGR01784 family)